MSKERKFHELIEQQDRDEKDRVWAKIQQKQAEELVVQKETDSKGKEVVLPKAPALPWRKWAAVAASSLAVVALGVFAVVKFFPSNINGANSSSGDNERYFNALSYDTVVTQTTLKEYAQEIGKDLLYFDWYEETDHLKDQACQLKDTQEIICYNEEIVDIDTGCMISIFVIDENTTLETLSTDENTEKQTEVTGYIVNWRYNSDKVIANFEYEGYKYYLRVTEPIDENYILTLIEELLS